MRAVGRSCSGTDSVGTTLASFSGMNGRHADIARKESSFCPRVAVRCAGYGITALQAEASPLSNPSAKMSQRSDTIASATSKMTTVAADPTIVVM